MATSGHDLDRKERQSVDSGYPSSPDSDFMCFEMFTSDLYNTPVDSTLDIKLQNDDFVSSLPYSPLKTSDDLTLFDEVDLSSALSDYSNMSSSTCTSPESSTKYSHLKQMLSQRPWQVVSRRPCVISCDESKDRCRKLGKLPPVSLTPEYYSTFSDSQNTLKYTKIKPKVRRCLEPLAHEQKHVSNSSISVEVTSKHVKKTKKKKTASIRTSKQKIKQKKENKNDETTKITKCSTGSCVHGACQARVLSIMKGNKGNRQDYTLVAPGSKLVNARQKFTVALHKASDEEKRRHRNSECNLRPALVPLSARDVALITSRVNNKPLEAIQGTSHVSAPKIRAILNQP